MTSLPENLARRFTLLRSALLAGCLFAPLSAQIGGYLSVNYTPSQKSININPTLLPYTLQYTLVVTSPASLSGSVTVPLWKQLTSPTSKPETVTDSTALSYVQFSGASLVSGEEPGVIVQGSVIGQVGGRILFTAANQMKTVTVTVTFPLGTVPGTYGYKLVTSDWPASGTELFVPRSSPNLGTDINASVSDASVNLPPAVDIGIPTNGQLITLTPAQIGAGVPLTFTATVPTNDKETPLPITSVTADVSPGPSGGGVNVPLVTDPVGLNSINVSGTGTIPIHGPGTYFITVRASNAVGPAQDAHSFQVVIDAPPPVAAITVPSGDPDYTWFVGGAVVVVPNSFRGDTDAPTAIQGFTVDLFKPIGSELNLPVASLSGIGTQTATGQVNLNFFSPDSGQYTLRVTTRNEYVTSEPVTATFWINRVTAPEPQTVLAFTDATFSINATGKPGLLYRWQRQAGGAGSWVDLSNDSIYTGASTNTLTITRAVVTMSGDLFRCQVGASLTTMQASPAASLTVRKLTPVLTWPTPAAIVYGTALSTLQLNATANTPGTFAYSPSSGVLNAGNQTLNVAFTPTDAVNYSNTSASVSLAVLKANQTITFGPLPAKTVGDAPFTLGATASSGLPVSYVSSKTAVATVAGDTVTIVGAGTTKITASQGGNNNYNAASPVSQTLSVTSAAKLDLVISKPDGSVITRVAGSPATSVPFEFKATATAATVTSLAAMLGSSALTVTPLGLNTSQATGTGTFSVNAAGTYTFSATATGTGGLVTTRSVTFIVKETQPPSVCHELHWLPPISLDQTHKGGSKLQIRFHIHACCQTGAGHEDDDDRGSNKGRSGDDDDDDRQNSKSSSQRHVCDENDRREDDRHDGWKDNGNGHCPLVKDTSVIVSIYEVGSSARLVMYTYSTKQNTKLPTYTIDGDKHYHLDFTPAKGTHRYRIEVDHFPNGSTGPVLLDSKEFKTR